MKKDSRALLVVLAAFAVLSLVWLVHWCRERIRRVHEPEQTERHPIYPQRRQQHAVIGIRSDPDERIEPLLIEQTVDGCVWYTHPCRNKIRSLKNLVKKAIMNCADQKRFQECQIKLELRALLLLNRDSDSSSIKIDIRKQARFAFRITINGHRTFAVGIYLMSVVDVSSGVEGYSVFTKEIESLLYNRGQSYHDSSKQRKKPLTDGKKVKVKGKFRCSKCGNKWTSYHAFIDRDTGLPWKGRSQRCRDCRTLAEMTGYQDICNDLNETNDDHQSSLNKHHRADLCQWCGEWNLKGDHTRLKGFISPSFAKYLIERGPGTNDLEYSYMCHEWERMEDDSGFTMSVYPMGVGNQIVIQMEFNLHCKEL